MDGSGCEQISVGDHVEVTRMRVRQLNDPSEKYCDAGMFPFRITGTVSRILNKWMESTGGVYGLAGGAFHNEGERFYLEEVKYEIRGDLKSWEELGTSLVELWGKDADRVLTDQNRQLSVRPKQWSNAQRRVLWIDNIEILQVRRTMRTGSEEE